MRKKVALGEETAGNPGPQPSSSNMKRLVIKNNKYRKLNIFFTRCGMMKLLQLHKDGLTSVPLDMMQNEAKLMELTYVF